MAGEHDGITDAQVAGVVTQEQIEGGGAGAADGAPAAAPAAPAAGADAAPADGTAAPFHTYGEETFNTPDELNEFIRRGVLSHAEYTRRNDELTQNRQQYERDVGEYNQRLQTLQTQQQRYDRIDAALKSRPDVQRLLGGLLGEAPSADTVRQSMSPELQALEQRMTALMQPLIDAQKERQEQQQEQEMLRAVFDDRATFPHGVDEAKVAEALAAIRQSPQPSREVATFIARLFQKAAPGGAENVTPFPARTPGAGGGGGRAEAPAATGKTIAETREILRARAGLS